AEEARPGEELVAAVEAAHPAVSEAARRRLREAVAVAAGEVPERVAAKGVAREEDDVQGEHERADAEPEPRHARRGIGEPASAEDVEGEDDEEEEREVEEVAVQVLEDERKLLLPAVAVARLADAAGGRVGPEAAVVGAAVVVTGEPEEAGRPED